MAAGVGTKATMPDREDRPRGDRGRAATRAVTASSRKHGGQPHRVRGKGSSNRDGARDGGRDQNRGHNGDRSITNVVPFDPLAADRARSAANANRPVSANQGGEAKPDGEIRRRPRGRRPSNGGKGYVAKG